MTSPRRIGHNLSAVFLFWSGKLLPPRRHARQAGVRLIGEESNDGERQAQPGLDEETQPPIIA